METIYVFGGFLDERSSSTGRLRTSLVGVLSQVVYTVLPWDCPGDHSGLCQGQTDGGGNETGASSCLYKGWAYPHDIRCTAITERNTHSYRAGAAIPRRAYRTQRHTQRMTNNDDYWTGGYMSGSTPIKYSLTQYLQSAAHVYHTA